MYQVFFYMSLIFHAECNIVFPVKCVGNKTDHSFGYNFLNENNSSFRTHLRIIIHDIKTKIDLFEMDVERNFESFYTGIFKHESNQTYITGIVPKIQFGMWRYKRL